MSLLVSKKDLLLQKIHGFFKEKRAIDLMISVVTGQTVLSLRLLDWLVTNYSKKYKVSYNGINDLHSEYRNQLKAYSKKLFDPFCRRDRVTIEELPVETTIGQLNFFRWAITKDVLKFASDNIDRIEEDMTKSYSTRKTTTHKRQRCVVSKGGISQNSVPILISFA